jgi:hypothetical protein
MGMSLSVAEAQDAGAAAPTEQEPDTEPANDAPPPGAPAPVVSSAPAVAPVAAPVAAPAAPPIAAPAPAAPPRDTIVHRPGDGVTFIAGDDSRYRLRMAIAPMFRFAHQSNVTDDLALLTIRRARFSFDTKLPYHLRTRFDMQIKNTGLTFRQVYGAWVPSRSFGLYVGLIKPPGGLEIDSGVFDQAFTDRSILSGMFTKEFHEVGAKAEGWVDHTRWFYAAGLTRNAPSIEPVADEPEDKAKLPPNAEPEDILNAPSKWNLTGRFGIAPSKHFETSLSVRARLRPEFEEPDYGETFAEPYEDVLVTQRPYYGVSMHVLADAGVSVEHFRLLAGVGYRQDGQQLDVSFTTGAVKKLDGHLSIEAGQITLGYTPFGHYGPARKNAPLLDGWEILGRIEGARIDPVDIAAVLYLGMYAGINWQVHPEVRLQLDYALEMFNDHAENGQAGAKRHVVNLWSVFRI